MKNVALGVDGATAYARRMNIVRRCGIQLAIVGAMSAMAGMAGALDNPYPDYVIVSPGVKIAYTFGDEGGLTFGGEISMLFRNGPDAGVVLAHGPALNFGWASRGIFQFRLGYELASWLIGVEAGPGLVTDRTGTHFAIGVTPWLGAIFAAPFYTHAFVFGGRSVDEVGTYLKLPLCFGCPSGGGGHGSVLGGIGHDHHH